jgi:hypothetical protein
MRARYVSLVVGAAAALHAREALAGMPTPVLTEWAQARVETLSFFVVVLLVCAAVIRWLWNGLAKDFPAMPRLSYGRTLALVVLLGLCLAVVLTMIAGARELLTPGAWQQNGLLYKLPTPPEQAEPAKPADPKALALRRERLENLQKALWRYADGHQGRLPESDTSPEIEPALWELPGVAEMHYLYVHGLKIGQPLRVLAFEPDVFGGDRLVLRTDGKIVALSTAELRKQLPEKPR